MIRLVRLWRTSALIYPSDAVSIPLNPKCSSNPQSNMHQHCSRQIFVRSCPSFSPVKKTPLLRSVFGFLFVVFLGLTASVAQAQTQTVVQKYGQLRVQGNRIVDQTGTAVQLRGMSLYWSQWIPKYYSYNTLKWLRDDWKITVVRAAVGINGTTDGYLVNPTAEKNKVFAVVDAAISLGIYVIIDWHDHTASDHRSQAQAFFAEMAQKYGNTPNVLYEVWNEPLAVSWSGVIKPYHQALVSTIRQYDADNIIICGTKTWSQDVDEAAADPVSGTNIAYTLHFYANTHKQFLRDKATTALNRGAALFVTEYGTTDASGNGTVNAGETATWWAFLDANKISHANWSVADISESSAALNAGASENGGWTLSQIKQSGQLVRTECIAKAPDLSTTTPPPTGGTTPANGTFKIVGRASGKALDANGNGTADGTQIIQWTYGGGNNQRWTLLNRGSNQYSIIGVASGKALDVSGSSTTNGAKVQLWTYGGGNNQKWTFAATTSGYYRVTPVHATGGCLEVTGNSTANGALVEFWTYSGGTGQQWAFSAP